MGRHADAEQEESRNQEQSGLGAGTFLHGGFSGFGDDVGIVQSIRFGM
jgi:hypothetical protein